MVLLVRFRVLIHPFARVMNGFYGAISDLQPQLMWLSDVLPGNVNDLAAARESVLAELRLFVEEMPALADGGYEGASHGILTPVKKPAGIKELDINGSSNSAGAGA
jgi:hypothetical protein